VEFFTSFPSAPYLPLRLIFKPRSTQSTQRKCKEARKVKKRGLLKGGTDE
jgi:hypothetical protein